MTLELIKLTEEIAAAGQHIAAQAKARAEYVPNAVDKLTSLTDLDDLQARVAKAGELYSGAIPTHELPSTAIDVPDLPKQVAIIATDGSQINPDLHAPVLYYIINVSGFVLRMGSASAPEIERHPKLAFRDEELNQPNSNDPLTHAMISLMRTAGEMAVLKNMSLKELETTPGTPVVALMDGQIALRGKAAEVGREFLEPLEADYLNNLDTLAAHQVALGSYVTRPNGRVLTRLLKLAELPFENIVWATGSTDQSQNLNAPYGGLLDRTLLEKWLKPGQRTALFENSSGWNRVYRERTLKVKGQPVSQSIHYFYLNVGTENQANIARIDLPHWVAVQPELVNLLHAAVVQQCGITVGPAYPYVLARADEEAVIQSHEKTLIENLLQQACLENKYVTESSPKLTHKGRARYGKPRSRR